MTHVFTLERTIACPPDRVYAALVSPTARLEWMEGLTSMVPEREGALAPGVSWTDTRSIFGIDETEHVTVVEATPGARLVLEVDGGQGTARRGLIRFAYDLSPHDGGARIAVSCTVDDLSRKGAILVRFLGEPFARRVSDDLAAMERWAVAQAS